MSTIELVILPRHVMTWVQFCEAAPPGSIALDGIVSGGPNYDEQSLHVNFDHHDGVVREATMSTAMQVFFAIKMGLFSRFTGTVRIWMNDADQDTALACWLLMHHKQLTGEQSHPSMNRLLTLTDRLDVTGGAFPMSLNDEIVGQHAWVFAPYTNARKSGDLARANANALQTILEAVFSRLDKLWLGQAETQELDTRHHILYTSDRFGFRIVDEIGGNDARYHLFARGQLNNGYVSIVARRSDGRTVYTIGRPSRYVHFPVPSFYELLNGAEGGLLNEQWSGSDIVGGSPRVSGSALSWEQIRDLLETSLNEQFKKAS